MRQAQREEAQRRQRARDRRNLILIVAALAVVGAAIFLVAVFLNRQSQVAESHRLSFVAQTGEAGQAVPDEGRNHIAPSTTAQYQHYPPASGPHYSVAGVAPANWQTIGDLPEGVYIHNLEHGGIAILYDCPSGQACDSLKGQLTNYVQNLAPREPRFGKVKLVMTPYQRGMEHKVALLAWDRIEWLDSYDQKTITRFYELYVDKGPEDIP
jgi:hypothetical protein